MERRMFFRALFFGPPAAAAAITAAPVPKALPIIPDESRYDRITFSLDAKIGSSPKTWVWTKRG